MHAFPMYASPAPNPKPTRQKPYGQFSNILMLFTFTLCLLIPSTSSTANPMPTGGLSYDTHASAPAKKKKKKKGYLILLPQIERLSLERDEVMPVFLTLKKKTYQFNPKKVRNANHAQHRPDPASNRQEMLATLISSLKEAQKLKKSQAHALTAAALAGDPVTAKTMGTKQHVSPKACS
jgi:hypothetical protein